MQAVKHFLEAAGIYIFEYMENFSVVLSFFINNPSKFKQTFDYGSGRGSGFNP